MIEKVLLVVTQSRVLRFHCCIGSICSTAPRNAIVKRLDWNLASTAMSVSVASSIPVLDPLHIGRCSSCPSFWAESSRPTGVPLALRTPHDSLSKASSSSHSAGDMHMQGFIHGDAFLDNCIFAEGEKLAALVQTPSPKSIMDRTQFESVKVTPRRLRTLRGRDVPAGLRRVTPQRGHGGCCRCQ